MQKFAVIVAGGSGNRMKSKTPKQFLKLGDKPVILHTLSAFYEQDKGIKIVVVINSIYFDLWKSICKKHSCRIPHKVINGGETRFNSVKNGLDAIENKKGYVAIHDSVRPLIDKKLISRCFKSAMINKNAIPAVTPSESVRVKNSNIIVPVKRDNVFLIQTPQVFSLSLIRKAYHQDFKPEFTDDATVFETSGEKINIIEGDPLNIKLTTPSDIELAEAILKQRRNKLVDLD